jgi:hypothetical protein
MEKKTSDRLIGLGFFILFVIGAHVYDRHKQIALLDRMAAITAAHQARVAAFDNHILEDKRWELPEVRAQLRVHMTAVCKEADETAQETKDANGGKLEPENAADYNAAKKVCDDTFALYDIADHAEWVPGADGGFVINDGELKDRFRSKYAMLQEDVKSLNAADSVANAGFKKQQAEGRK